MLLSGFLATAIAMAAAAAASGIPRACEWTEWQPAGRQSCHWQNKTVGVQVQDRTENRFVTYCSQVVRVRQRRCEGDVAASKHDGNQLEFDYRQPKAFRVDGEHPDGEPVRDGDDQCPEEKCPPLHGQWCYWIVYSSCEYHCRHAAKNETEVFIQKKRICSCPKPRNSGNQCAGPSSERERCVCVSLGASFASFLRTTEGILIACGVGIILLVFVTCCVSRVCCDTDDGTEDFKISELPQAQRQQHQEPLLLNLNPPGAPQGHAETNLCDLTSSDQETSGSLQVRLPANLAGRVPPPLPPKRYKEKQQQQQEQELRSRRQLSFDPEPPVKYTPPFPNEV